MGSRIVREALDRGHAVTGIGRTPANITERHERLTVVQGDVTDTDSVIELVAGHDVVISAVGGVNPDSDDPMLSMIGHALALNYLRTLTDIEWTFVAPPLDLRPGERTGVFRVGPGVVMRDAEGRNSVSMEDLAVAIIDEIESPGYIGRSMTAAY